MNGQWMPLDEAVPTLRGWLSTANGKPVVDGAATLTTARPHTVIDDVSNPQVRQSLANGVDAVRWSLQLTAVGDNEQQARLLAGRNRRALLHQEAHNGGALDPLLLPGLRIDLIESQGDGHLTGSVEGAAEYAETFTLTVQPA